MSRRVALVIAAILVVAASAYAWRYLRPHLDPAANAAHTAAPPPIPVSAGMAELTDVPVYLTGLGTVQAFNTVTVRVRVDGQLDKVAFTEGETVKAGDLLAQVDPRPFQAVLDQAKAAKTRDQAQLENAEHDLQRFEKVGTLAETQQSIDTQKALIRQLQATIEGDQANIESAQTQLDYTTITAPISGRTGIRLVDVGNIVHATDVTGLVVITQLQPISVIFNLPDDQLGNITKEMGSGALLVTAVARTDQQPLGDGTLSLVDNLIDQTTGTIRLKATFPNDNNALWPGQFVNIRLLLRTLQQVVAVPATAIQRGPDNMYVYVIKPDATVAMQTVSVAQMNAGKAVVEKGLAAGARVVISGQYRLQQGSRVQADDARSAAAVSEN
jgi:multidrug efflux system membrane fusion protein